MAKVLLLLLFEPLEPLQLLNLRVQRRLLLLEAVDELRDLPAALGEDELCQVVLLRGAQQLAHAHQERQQHRALIGRAHRAALEHLLESGRLRDVDLLQQHLQRAQQCRWLSVGEARNAMG